MKISVICTGRGCAFKKHVTRIVDRCARTKKGSRKCAPPQKISLEGLFSHRHLGVHTKFVVLIAHPDWVGKYYRFIIRSGRTPDILESCLAPGSARPGAGCTRS